MPDTAYVAIGVFIVFAVHIIIKAYIRHRWTNMILGIFEANGNAWLNAATICSDLKLCGKPDFPDVLKRLTDRGVLIRRLPENKVMAYWLFVEYKANI